MIVVVSTVELVSTKSSVYVLPATQAEDVNMVKQFSFLEINIQSINPLITFVL